VEVHQVSVQEAPLLHPDLSRRHPLNKFIIIITPHLLKVHALACPWFLPLLKVVE
jgi:hypothetical protein